MTPFAEIIRKNCKNLCKEVTNSGREVTNSGREVTNSGRVPTKTGNLRENLNTPQEVFRRGNSPSMNMHICG